ncbi:peptide chain release factor N(5)-glutamine methyltransferase [Winogradskyella immobilis]|uniref:Release factor glutamine methyltransferase n=1 Tax=Winogradskyella immobilis TaxID=2816852 RepID=A0ABS8EP39_9FLAO|nr:peptide chain release factor N(5)-glutamine methyltransferase [Winogradskyella immobilis]MCC1484791.1 peptide chain release factor N(5)-glutamine methyltransferase [Winogradskyella immobilis]MCG0016883.1 peptide chain release factor N(5)-glutamine methyltransferase [Winogradskyella immobilis]
MKLKAIQNTFHSALDTLYNKNEVDRFFFMLTEHYFNFTRIQLVLEPHYSIDENQQQLLFLALEDLKLQKPIQYIIGETEFYELKFKVNSNVLIPRPETEELVDWILKTTKTINQPITILDIGTGSGCIAISLAKNLPNSKVYALDVSEEALQIAKTNADLNAVNVEFIKSNILEQIHFISEQALAFDIIVSNPPYVRELEKYQIKPNVIDNEPHLALFVEDNNPLLFYDAICKLAVNKLKPNGKLFFEINQYLGKEMLELLAHYNFDHIELRKDIYDNDRIIKGIKKQKI